jgi:hypothetical protein
MRLIAALAAFALLPFAVYGQEAADQLTGAALADAVNAGSCNYPFLPNFSTVSGCDDPNLAKAQYCMTDGACQCDVSKIYGPKIDCVPNCSHICYFSSSENRLLESKIYNVNNKPDYFISCGWETCDPYNRSYNCSGAPLDCKPTVAQE